MEKPLKYRLTAPRYLACVMQGRLLSRYPPELVEGKELFAPANDGA